MGLSPRAWFLPDRTQPPRNHSLQPELCRLLMVPPKMARLPNLQRSVKFVWFSDLVIFLLIENWNFIEFLHWRFNDKVTLFFHVQVHQSISNVTGGGSLSIGVDGGTTSRHESTKGKSFPLLSVSSHM